MKNSIDPSIKYAWRLHGVETFCETRPKFCSLDVMFRTQPGFQNIKKNHFLKMALRFQDHFLENRNNSLQTTNPTQLTLTDTIWNRITGNPSVVSPLLFPSLSPTKSRRLTVKCTGCWVRDQTSVTGLPWAGGVSCVYIKTFTLFLVIQQMSLSRDCCSIVQIYIFHHYVWCMGF